MGEGVVESGRGDGRTLLILSLGLMSGLGQTGWGEDTRWGAGSGQPREPETTARDAATCRQQPHPHQQSTPTQPAHEVCTHLTSTFLLRASKKEAERGRS